MGQSPESFRIDVLFREYVLPWLNGPTMGSLFESTQDFMAQSGPLLSPTRPVKQKRPPWWRPDTPSTVCDKVEVLWVEGDGGGTLMYFRQTNGLLAIFLATEKLVGAQMVVIGIG